MSEGAKIRVELRKAVGAFDAALEGLEDNYTVEGAEDASVLAEAVRDWAYDFAGCFGLDLTGDSGNYLLDSTLQLEGAIHGICSDEVEGYQETIRDFFTVDARIDG